ALPSELDQRLGAAQSGSGPRCEQQSRHRAELLLALRYPSCHDAMMPRKAATYGGARRALAQPFAKQPGSYAPTSVFIATSVPVHSVSWPKPAGNRGWGKVSRWTRPVVSRTALPLPPHRVCNSTAAMDTAVRYR